MHNHYELTDIKLLNDDTLPGVRIPGLNMLKLDSLRPLLVLILNYLLF